MKQFPNNLKYKKYHKANYFYHKSLENKIYYPNYGEFFIQSIQAGKLTYKQIESCRRTIKRGLKKTGSLFIKIFTNIPIYKKSLASRMGKGKGNLSTWIATIKSGTVLFEISGVNENKIAFILNKSKTKLPIKTKIIKAIY